jgi:hypothetical protein
MNKIHTMDRGHWWPRPHGQSQPPGSPRNRRATGLGRELSHQAPPRNEPPELRQAGDTTGSEARLLDMATGTVNPVIVLWVQVYIR